MRTFMILVLLSSLAAAQELPEAPSQRATPKSFWVAAGAYTASIIYDGETTVRGVESGCVENWNPTLYGERPGRARSEEHTPELQSHSDIVCRLLLEKKDN